MLKQFFDCLRPFLVKPRGPCLILIKLSLKNGLKLKLMNLKFSADVPAVFFETFVQVRLTIRHFFAQTRLILVHFSCDPAVCHKWYNQGDESWNRDFSNF